jgi:hypothetical protein
MITEKEGEGAFVKRKNGSQTTAALKIFKITGDRGYVYLLRDLSAEIKLKESMEKMNVELPKMIERERKVMEYLFRFSRITDPKRLAEIWQAVEKEESEVKSILEPVYGLMEEYVRLYDQTTKSKEEIASKTAELEFLNHYLSGREGALKALEQEYQRLKA